MDLRKDLRNLHLEQYRDMVSVLRFDKGIRAKQDMLETFDRLVDDVRGGRGRQ